MGACVAQTCTRRVTPPQEQPAKPDYLSTRSQRYSTLTVTGASITPDGHWRFEQARVTSRPSKHTARRWSGDAEDCQRSGAWTLARFLEATALRTVDQDGCSGRARKHLHRRQCCDTKFTHGSVRSPSGIDEISTAVDPNEWDEGCTELRATLSIKQNRSVGAAKSPPTRASPRARVSAASLVRHVWPHATASPDLRARRHSSWALISARRFIISVCLPSWHLRSGPLALGLSRPGTRAKGQWGGGRCGADCDESHFVPWENPFQRRSAAFHAGADPCRAVCNRGTEGEDGGEDEDEETTLMTTRGRFADADDDGGGWWR